jgi:putative addiction module component (TIGR02574 family)
MRSLDKLTEELLSLPNAERALLAEKLVESLEFDIDPTIEEAWTSEAKKRLDAVRDDSVTTIPGDEAPPPGLFHSLFFTLNKVKDS